jgi:hypothetical protein
MRYQQLVDTVAMELSKVKRYYCFSFLAFSASTLVTLEEFR